MNKIPVGKTVAYAYSFTFGHLGTVVGLTWLAMLLTIGLNYAGLELMNPAGMDEAAIRANPSLAFKGFGYFLITLIVAMFFQAVMAVALCRQALGLRTGGALIHLAAGRDEWRMFGGHLRYFFASLAVVIIFYIGLLIIGVVSGLLIAAVQSSVATGIVGLAAIIAMIALGAAAIYTLVRMGFVLSPSIVAERGGGIKRSYDLTQGNFWRIVLVWLFVSLPLLLVFMAVQYALYWHVFDLDFSTLPRTPDAVKQFMERYSKAMQKVNVEMMQQIIPLQISTFVFGILAAGLGYSAASFAYRALVPADTAPQSA
jgi:hypothetical protein